MNLAMCACARTGEFCRTTGCKREDMSWIYATEGRKKDHLRRIIRQKDRQPVSRWVRPERAVAEAYAMNLEGRRGVIFITKMGLFRVQMDGMP